MIRFFINRSLHSKISYDIPYTWKLKNETNEQDRNRLRHTEPTYGCQSGGFGEEIVREFGIDIYTLLYLIWITSKDLLYSTGNSIQCYMAAWMGGVFWGELIDIYVWLSPFAVHLK